MVFAHQTSRILSNSFRQPMADVTKPVTLSDLERDGKLAGVYCNACGRERDVRPADLGLPLDTPVPEAAQRPPAPESFIPVDRKPTAH